MIWHFYLVNKAVLFAVRVYALVLFQNENLVDGSNQNFCCRTCEMSDIASSLSLPSSDYCFENIKNQ